MPSKASNQSFLSLNSILLIERVPLRWAPVRIRKFFADVGLGTVYQKRAQTGRSKPYLLSEMFGYVKSRRRTAHLDVIREIIRVEWYLLDFERRMQRLNKNGAAILFVKRHEKLIASLKTDGYSVTDGELVPSSNEELQQGRGSLQERLARNRFDLASRHYQQAWDNYVLGNWEAANAQLRTFLECLLDEIALRLFPSDSSKALAGGERRKVLESKGFIEGERRTLVRGFFEMAHTKGSHPGWSDEEDCRFRQGIVAQLGGAYLDKFVQSDDKGQ